MDNDVSRYHQILARVGEIIRRNELPFRPYLHAHIPRMTLVASNSLKLYLNIKIFKYHLREFACANERHPGDVRVKVGSERKFASSDTRAKTRQKSVSSRSVVTIDYLARGGPPKLAVV